LGVFEKYKNQGVGQSAVKGAATGYKIGKFLGPQGAAFGAAIGGIFGAGIQMSKVDKELDAEQDAQHRVDSKKFYEEGGYEKWGSMAKWENQSGVGDGDTAKPVESEDINKTETEDVNKNIAQNTPPSQPPQSTVFNPSQIKMIQSVFGPQNTYGSLFTKTF